MHFSWLAIYLCLNTLLGHSCNGIYESRSWHHGQKYGCLLKSGLISESIFNLLEHFFEEMTKLKIPSKINPPLKRPIMTNLKRHVRNLMSKDPGMILKTLNNQQYHKDFYRCLSGSCWVLVPVSTACEFLTDLFTFSRRLWSKIQTFLKLDDYSSTYLRSPYS